MSIQLTPFQLRAKEVIDWLTDEHWHSRGVGKSYLMAVCFIERGIKNRNTWINIWDHGPWHPKKDQFMLECIQQILKEHYPELKYKINISNKAFQIDE